MDKVNPIFVGQSFRSIAWYLFDEFQVITVGVRVEYKKGKFHHSLNPGPDYRIQNDDNLLFISQNFRDISMIRSLVIIIIILV